MKQINKSKQYSALTIDTSIFNQYGLKLEKGLLAKLVQFKEMPINFVLSDVVYREVMNHLNKKEKEVRDKIKASLTDVSDYFGCKELALEEVISLLNIDYDGNDKGSNARLNKFKNQCGIEIIKSKENIDVSFLLDLYFTNSAPFKEVGSKKNEFPDAIALLALEKWAIENNKEILAVSVDNDWKRFSEERKNNIDVVEDLARAIEVFQEQMDYALKGIVEEIKQDLSNNPNSKILESIREVISDKLVVSEINADAAYYYEIDDEWVELNKISILTENSELRVHIVDKGSDTITVNIACEVCCRVGATFDFSIWDSVDKEYIRLGSSQEIVEQVYETNVLVSLSGNFLNGLSDMEIDDIEVDNTLGSVEMGEIQPFENDESYYQ